MGEHRADITWGDEDTHVWTDEGKILYWQETMFGETGNLLGAEITDALDFDGSSALGKVELTSISRTQSSSRKASCHPAESG